MINLDRRYHSYLDGSKKMRIDGIEERLSLMNWHMMDDIKGHCNDENYKLFYNMEGLFTKMVALETGTECCVNEYLSDIIGV